MRRIDSASETVLATVADLLESTVREANGAAPPDPAPAPQEVAMRRMVELLAQISDSAVSDLRRLRDDVDAAIRQIQSTQGSLCADFQHHVESVVESMRFRQIASEHLDNVRARFAIPTQRTQQIAAHPKDD
jgi:hypothetical protein